MTRHPVTGVELGAGSPLLTKGGRLRQLGPSEAEIQIAAVEVLLGPIGRAGRELHKGLCTKYPELLLLTALNPNKGGRKKAAAGIAKAMGLCPDYPDLHLPVTRGPFLTLYVEVKRPGGKPTSTQLLMHHSLRHQGHCVVVCESAQEIVDAIVGYLKMPPNGIGAHPMVDDQLNKHLLNLREMWHERLQPRREPGVGRGRSIMIEPLSEDERRRSGF